MNTGMCLRSDVLIEPLVHRWHAWPVLLAPLSAGLWARGRQLPMLARYLDDPAGSFRAAQDPSNLGAWIPWIPAERAAEVAALVHEMRAKQAPLLELADQYRAAAEGLRKRSPSASLGGEYGNLGPSLRGRAEFHFDLAHHPQLRIRERMLQAEQRSLWELQSVLLRRAHGGPRLPILSTPRLAEAGTLELSIPFSSPLLDRLAWSRVRPVDPAELADEASLVGGPREEFMTFFGVQHRPSPRYDGPGLRIRYFNHACILIESRATSILCDPWLPYAPTGAADRFSIADLPERIDFVVITHGHADHLVIESLLAIRPRVDTLVVPRSLGGPVDPSLRRLLVEVGFPRVLEVEDLDQIPVEDGSITALPFLGEHAELPIGSKVTYCIDVGGRSVFVGADTDGIDPAVYAHAREGKPPIDVAFLGMECEGAPLNWLYEPFLEQPLPREHSVLRRMNGCDASRGMAVVRALGARTVLIYALGSEPWLQHVTLTRFEAHSRPIREADALIAECTAQGRWAARLHGSCELNVGD